MVTAKAISANTTGLALTGLSLAVTAATMNAEDLKMRAARIPINCWCGYYESWTCIERISGQLKTKLNQQCDCCVCLQCKNLLFQMFKCLLRLVCHAWCCSAQGIEPVVQGLVDCAVDSGGAVYFAAQDAVVRVDVGLGLVDVAHLAVDKLFDG